MLKPFCRVWLGVGSLLCARTTGIYCHFLESDAMNGRTNPQKFTFEFAFSVPSDQLLRAMQELLALPDNAVQSIAKALLDVTREGVKIQTAMANHKDAHLGPYFDFWFGDAIASARALLTSDDKNVRALAECLIEQEQNIIESKESFLREQKRLGIPPKRS